MRRTVRTLALATACSLLVAACDAVGTANVLPALKSVRLSGQQQTIANQLVTDVVANAQAYTDLDLAALFTDGGSAAAYRAQRAGGKPPAAQQRDNKVKERFKQQLDKHKGGMKATSVATESVTVDGVACVATTTQLQFSRGAVTQSQTLTRTVDPDGDVLKVVQDMSRTFQNGHAFTAHRERTNAADGSYTVLYHSEATMKGRTRVVDWTRTGAADGSETGTGTIKRANGTIVTITVTKTADGVTTTVTKDTAAKVGVEVAQTDGATEATAKVTDSSTGTETVAGTVTVDAEATEPAAE